MNIEDDVGSAADMCVSVRRGVTHRRLLSNELSRRTSQVHVLRPSRFVRLRLT